MTINHLMNFLSAAVPSNFEYDISGEEFNDHIPGTNGRHFTFPYQESGLVSGIEIVYFKMWEPKNSPSIHSFTMTSDMEARDCIIMISD